MAIYMCQPPRLSLKGIDRAHLENKEYVNDVKKHCSKKWVSNVTPKIGFWKRALHICVYIYISIFTYLSRAPPQNTISEHVIYI